MNDVMNVIENGTQVGFANEEALSIMQEVAEEYRGLNFSPDRIKVGAGGSTTFELPGDGDEPDVVKSISCVIVHQHPANVYYAEAFHGGNLPPDCSSVDGIMGNGNPGGNCAACPYNQFGSAGNGKACKNRRVLYVLREGEAFPMILNLPVGSIKEFTNYVKRLLTKGRKLNQVVTKIGVKRATSKDGIAYSQVTFSVERLLDTAEKDVVGKITTQVKASAGTLSSAALVDDGAAGDGAFVSGTADLEEDLPFN